MKKALQIIGVLLLVVTVGVCIAIYLVFKEPSTADMRAYYTDHRTALEQRNHDILAALDRNESPATGADTAAGYRFVSIEQEPARTIIYATHISGFGVASSVTGIAWLELPPTTTYSSLEVMRDKATLDDGFTGYLPLADNWYLFFRQVD